MSHGENGNLSIYSRINSRGDSSGFDLGDYYPTPSFRCPVSVPRLGKNLGKKKTIRARYSKLLTLSKDARAVERHVADPNDRYGVRRCYGRAKILRHVREVRMSVVPMIAGKHKANTGDQEGGAHTVSTIERSR